MKDRVKYHSKSRLDMVESSSVNDCIEFRAKGTFSIYDEENNLLIRKSNLVVQNAVRIFLELLSNQPDKGISKLLLGSGGLDSNGSPVKPSCSDTSLQDLKYEKSIESYSIDYDAKKITFETTLLKEEGNSTDGVAQYSEYALARSDGQIFSRVTDYPIYKTPSKSYRFSWTIELDWVCREE